MDIYSLLSRLPVGRFKEPPPVVSVLRLAGVIGGRFLMLEFFLGESK